MSDKKEVTHLAWVDLETTGTDESRDEIIEFALIVTDMSLAVTYEYDTVVLPARQDWFDRIRSIDAVYHMHTDNGLIQDVRSNHGEDLFRLDRWLGTHLQGKGHEPKTIMLAGSGVGHFDSRFIKAHMPEFTKLLAYPVIDVGVMRRFLRDVCGRPELIPADGEGAIKTHRAMDDIRLHLSEARYYRNMLGQVFDVATPEALTEEAL